MKRKQLALRVLSTAAVLSIVSSIAAPVFAETYYVDYGDIKVDGSSVNYHDASGNSQKNQHDEDIVITNKNKDVSTSHTVTINASEGSTADVTLKDVNIDTSSEGKAAVTVTGDGTTSIELDGKNTLTSGDEHAGLEKNNADGKGDLVIKDDTKDGGSLEATGGTNGGAGIGGGNEQSTSNITITGGTIIATSKDDGAGIGGGYDGNGTNITITGGTVTATSEDDGAGIGGGSDGNGTNITITGGTVTATSESDGAGIGGGYYGDGTNITITGGTVTANGKEGGAGIGGGYEGDGADITITGGTVIASGGSECGAGIGGGQSGIGSNITVSGNASVTVRGGNSGSSCGTGAGIGNGGSYTADWEPVNGAEVSPNYTGMNKGHITYLDQADGHKVKILHNRSGCVWDEGEIIKEPTETETGLRLHHCILEADCSDPTCNNTWLEVLPKLASQLREVGVIFWDAANNAAAPEYLQGKTLNVEETSGAVSKAQADSVLADKEHWALAEDVGDLEIHPAADAAGTVYEQAVKASGFQYYVVANVTAQ